MGSQQPVNTLILLNHNFPIASQRVKAVPVNIFLVTNTFKLKGKLTQKNNCAHSFSVFQLTVSAHPQLLFPSPCTCFSQIQLYYLLMQTVFMLPLTLLLSAVVTIVLCLCSYTKLSCFALKTQVLHISPLFKSCLPPPPLCECV